MKSIAGATFAACLILAGCNKDAAVEPNAGTDSTKQSAHQSPELTKEAAPIVAAKNGPWTGPFGVQMGLSVADLEAAGLTIKKEQPGIYSSKSTPSPHKAFEGYNFVISDVSGLCKVNAVGKDIATNSFGEDLRSAFKELKGALTEKYGEPSDDYDFLRKGSIWRDSRDWMMALKQKDRTLASFWSLKSTSHGGLEAVMLDASATNSNEGYITLRYSFKNESECLEEVRKAENSSL